MSLRSGQWRDLTYLKTGTPRQREAFSVLGALRILEILQPFDPVLVSTVCVGLDIAGSDLDIICEVHEPSGFESLVRQHFAACDGFQFRWVSGDDAWVTSFGAGGFPIEIYAATIACERQAAYRHLTQMARILRLGGEAVRTRVRALKLAGLKTEPAFCQVLELTGDPYRAFLNLESKSDAWIESRLALLAVY
jgi:hypothetical protein